MLYCLVVFFAFGFLGASRAHNLMRV